MIQSLVIRRERPDQPDVQALLDDLDRYLATLYAPEANHILDVQALLAPDVAFYVARDAGQAIAAGAWRRMPGEPDTGLLPYAEIKRMVVAPARRGQGIAARLLATLEQDICAAGLRLALLETGRHQAEAVKLYERCGYALRGPFGGYPDNGLSAFYGKTIQ